VRLDLLRRVSIRPIDEFDRSALFDFYASLSPESSRRRFLSSSRPSAADVDRLAAADGFVAVLSAPGASDGRIVGHAAICREGPASAEIAFAVDDPLQGRGIGRALVAATVDEARRTGLTRLTAATFPENRAMRRLIVDAGCRVESDRVDAGVEEIELRLVSDASPAVAHAR
jgi:RimJ/RimL family protein N-acetyltransferase